jgi:hypothetical protein
MMESVHEEITQTTPTDEEEAAKGDYLLNNLLAICPNAKVTINNEDGDIWDSW